MKKKLVVKLFVIIITLLVIAMSVLMIVTSINSVSIVKSNLINKLTAISHERGKQIDTKISDLHQFAKTVADNDFVYDFYLKIKKGETDEDAKAKMGNNLAKIFGIYNPTFENIFFGLDGIIYIDGIGGKSVGFSMKDSKSEVYERVVTTKKHSLGKIDRSPINGLPIIVSFYPILNDKNEVLGTFGLPINLNSFSIDIVKSVKEDDFKTIVVDIDGNIIAAEDTSKIYKFNLSKANSSLSSLHKQIIKNDKGVEYFTYEGVECLGVFEKFNQNLICITYTPVSTYQDDIKSNIYGMLVLFVIIVVVIMVITFFLAKKITNPILKIVNLVNKMSRGDLTGKSDYKSEDELGQLSSAYNKMIDKLKNTIGGVQKSIKNIEVGTKEISINATQIAQGANEQAASSEDVSSSMEEITASINQNMESSQLLDKMTTKIDIGIDIVYNSVAKTSNSMQEIADKITVINEIAEKTDLLAINASIEASRAGEFGKGFSVVAVEVRKLAENSRKAAVHIEDITRKSVSLAQKSNTLLQDFIPEIKKANELVKEMSVASIEQFSNTNHINNGIQQLATVIQQNSASSEELATSSEELTSMALSLQSSIAFFATTKKMTSKKVADMEKYIDQLSNIVNTFKEKGDVPSEYDIGDIEQELTFEKTKPSGVNINFNDDEEIDIDNDFESIK